MEKVYKAVGALVGGAVSLLVIKMGWTEVFTDETIKVFVDSVVALAGPVIGTYVAPKNKE